MHNVDISNLTVDELSQLISDAQVRISELEVLSATPDEVALKVANFVRSGGEVNDVLAKITEALSSES